MKLLTPIEVTVNSIPLGRYAKFMWHEDSRYLLRLVRIDISYREIPVAIAHYTYLLEIERHTGYIVVTIHLFGKTWIINLSKRNFYVQSTNRKNQEQDATV
jgi:hypothetical protein